MGETITRGLVIGNRTRDEWVVELNCHFMTGAQRVIVASQHRSGAENREIIHVNKIERLIGSAAYSKKLRSYKTPMPKIDANAVPDSER